MDDGGLFRQPDSRQRAAREIPLGFLLMDPVRAGALGENQNLFVLSAGIHYAMVCFVAPALTAGAISGEVIADIDQLSVSPWLFFSCYYLVLAVLLVGWSAYLLRPIRRRRGLGWKRRPNRVK